MAKAPPTKEEAEHMAWIVSLPCILCEVLRRCQGSKTDCHHVREGQGGAQRAPHMLTIPVCHGDCHQGPQGIHGDRTLLKIAKVDELDLLHLVLVKKHLLLPRWVRAEWAA